MIGDQYRGSDAIDSGHDGPPHEFPPKDQGLTHQASGQPGNLPPEVTDALVNFQARSMWPAPGFDFPAGHFFSMVIHRPSEGGPETQIT